MKKIKIDRAIQERPATRKQTRNEKIRQSLTEHAVEQLDLFTDYEALKKQREEEKAELEREKKMQKAVLEIKRKFGKNAILKGMNLEEGATARERNTQIGGHKAESEGDAVMENNEQKYADIFNMPHHVSKKHPQMNRHDRAAQFAPFAALTGHDAAIRETARLTDERIELDESSKTVLNDKLQIALDFADDKSEITVTHFVEDESKSGGAYVAFTGVVKCIDEYERTVVFTDKTKIPIDDIYAIEGEIFNGFDY